MTVPLRCRLFLLLLLVILSSVVYSVSGQKYEGCYRTTVDDPDLPSLVLNRATATPTECIQECRSRYFMFAGLTDGRRCYCGSKYGRNGLSDSCDAPCTASDPTFHHCGGSHAISVYSTGRNGPSPPRRIRVVSTSPDSLEVTWQPPDIPNGRILSYNVAAVAVETYATDFPRPVRSRVQGEYANGTTVRDLQPGSKYNVSVAAENAHGSGEPISETAWTLIGAPNKPDPPRIEYRTDTTVTVRIARGSSERGPVTAYRVVVVRSDVIEPPSPSTDNVGDDVYPDYAESVERGLGYYVTGEFAESDLYRYQSFTVGDGNHVGDYYNAPLLDARRGAAADYSIPRIGLVVVSRARGQTRYSYSELTNGPSRSSPGEPVGRINPTTIALSVAIALLASLLLASVLLYFVLRRRHESLRGKKHPEQQELTLQGPVCEIDNMAYIPEDVPETVNHYQRLTDKVWTIPRNCLTVDKTIVRRGRFGTVHTGTVMKEDRPCAVTVHSIADGSMRSSEKRAMLRELDLCVRPSSMPYLAGLVGTCETPDTLYVALELPPRTLKERLLVARSAAAGSGDGFPAERVLLPIGSAVATALRYLHGYKIVHTHLCARSVGICDDWTPKLMGHGIGKYALPELKYARWTAPECFAQRNPHHQQTGVVWAFGVLLWEMFAMGATPYSKLLLDSEVESAVGSGVRLAQLFDIPDPVYQVMTSCWQTNHRDRPTFDELVRLNTLTICPISTSSEPYLPELEVE